MNLGYLWVRKNASGTEYDTVMEVVLDHQIQEIGATARQHRVRTASTTATATEVSVEIPRHYTNDFNENNNNKDDKNNDDDNANENINDNMDNNEKIQDSPTVSLDDY